jgi:hypothetical protein
VDIKIIDVTITEVPKKVGQGNNKQMSITFENLTFGGKTDGKKLMDWATPKAEVWDVLAPAVKGNIFRVETKKNDKGYIDWVCAEAIEAVAVVQAAVAAKVPRAAEKGEKVGSTWDEKNKLDRERFNFDKVKQGLIIRQSSLSTAVAMCTAGGKVAKTADVIKVATEFEAYVNGNAPMVGGIEEMSDDFPS